MNRDEEIRPFFGESAEVLSAPQPAPPSTEKRGTYEELRKAFIENGECPRPGCHRTLEEGACPGCGWSLLEERLAPVTVADKPDYVTTLPLALRLDEFAPADLHEDAA